MALQANQGIILSNNKTIVPSIDGEGQLGTNDKKFASMQATTFKGNLDGDVTGNVNGALYPVFFEWNTAVSGNLYFKTRNRGSSFGGNTAFSYYRIEIFIPGTNNDYISGMVRALNNNRADFCGVISEAKTSTTNDPTTTRSKLENETISATDRITSAIGGNLNSSSNMRCTVYPIAPERRYVLDKLAFGTIDIDRYTIPS